MTDVTLAVEDSVAEALVLTAIEQSGLRLSVGSVLQKKGITYLRSRAASLNAAANGGVSVILLADADSPTCPVELANAWFPNGRHSNLAFRFSVHAAEAWVLADAVGLDRHAGINSASVPEAPDDILDPKRALVASARYARRAFRDIVVPAPRSVIPVGPAYNPAVTRFIREDWRLERALERSPSLQSFLDRITRLQS